MRRTFINFSLIIVSILFWLVFLNKTSANEEVVWILVKDTNGSPVNPPIYGTQGVPDPANHPGVRYRAVSWINNDGTLFLYSGSDCSCGQYNDLWKYEKNINQWTWIAGEKGIKSDGFQFPGARRSSTSWIGNDGKLYIFGGEYNIVYVYSWGLKRNDLCRYDLTKNTWERIKGGDGWNIPGTYGTKGVPDSNNLPGSRSRITSWKGPDGSLYLFGGYGYGESVLGSLNDLWKFVISTNNWTWIHGAKICNQSGIYGSLGIPDSNNVPGARYGAVSCTSSKGKIYLFGGEGFDITGQSGKINDLWEYDPVANIWTWISGSQTINQPGTYGYMGIPNSDNVPGARSSCVSWNDQEGAIYIFGGRGYDYKGDEGVLSDLWKYDPETNQWTWLKGAKTIDYHGFCPEQGMIDPMNNPGSTADTVSWTGTDGVFWLYGGEPYFCLSLWRFQFMETGPRSGFVLY